MKRIVIGTRGSPLALAQVEIITWLLNRAHPEVRVEKRIIKTSGDKFLDVALSTVAGKGFFTKEIEDQLLAKEIDLAIHSLKDLPTTLPPGLTIGAVPEREDARDVFVSTKYASLDEVPQGARVATSSIRRRAQLLARRGDLQVEEIRGNVGTRLQKLIDQPELAGTVLAAAGLKRLGLWEKLEQYRFHVLGVEVMIPAVGQGIIGCEVREEDFEVQELLGKITHKDTLACAEAERAFLAGMGGGCQVPYAAHATVTGDALRLIGASFQADGTNAKHGEETGRKENALDLGELLAERIRANG